MATGTAANALALAALTPPWGVVYCHEESHIADRRVRRAGVLHRRRQAHRSRRRRWQDRAGQVAARLTERKASSITRSPRRSASPRRPRPARSIRRPRSRRSASSRASRGLALHMDGARFANAVAALGCTPAEITWRAGVDVLSFGATKNGALAAEAVIFFDPAKAVDFAYRRKRGGHLFSKMRFLSAPARGLSRRRSVAAQRARTPTAWRARLAEGLGAAAGRAAALSGRGQRALRRVAGGGDRALCANGFRFYRWGGDRCMRLVTAFDSRIRIADAFIAVARGIAGCAPRTSLHRPSLHQLRRTLRSDKNQCRLESCGHLVRTSRRLPLFAKPEHEIF